MRVDTLEELFDAASLFSSQPLPKGRRVAILTNGGGPGIMTADACGAHGLEVAGLSEKTASGLRGFLHREASVGNPIDMTAEASAEDYGHSLHLLAEDDLIDIVIVIFVPPILTQEEEVAKAIREISPEFCRRGKTRSLPSWVHTEPAPLWPRRGCAAYHPSFFPKRPPWPWPGHVSIATG